MFHMFHTNGRSKPFGPRTLGSDGNFDLLELENQSSKETDYEVLLAREKRASKIRRIWLFLQIVGCKYEGSFIGPAWRGE
jgi:hypothetical protein